MGASGGGGGRPGRGGGGPDMTTPVEQMGLEDTVRNIYATKQAISTAESDMSKAYDVEGKAGREMRSALRDVRNKLEDRRNKLEGSITRSVTGPKGNYRETLIKGKEMIDLGPYKGFSAHYGTVGTKAKKFSSRSDLDK